MGDQSLRHFQIWRFPEGSIGLLGAALVLCALLAYVAGLAVGLHAGERRGRLEVITVCGEAEDSDG